MPSTSDGELAQVKFYPIDFITQSPKLQTAIDDDYLYPLLAPTKLSLLQQQPLRHRQ